MADPVAEFLAREQDLLADIDGVAPPPINPPAQVAPAPPAASDEDDEEPIADDFDAFMMGPPSVGGGDSGVDLAGMDSRPTPPVPLINGHGVSSNQSAASSKGASPVPVLPRVEAENIRRWREQHKILLEKKDEAEEKKKNELRAAAKKELDDWYKQRDAALKLTREANRKAEEEHLAAFGREQGEGAQWDEIARLCEAKAQKGGKDVSRLKSLLLHLKDHHRKWRNRWMSLLMDDRANGPSSEELLELIEKQDVMIDCLTEKLEVFNNQMRILREAEERKWNSEHDVNVLVASAEQKVTSTLAAVELLRTENEKLQNDLDELRKKNMEEVPVTSVIQLRSRVKELEFELHREQQASNNLRNEIDFHKSRIEQLQCEIESNNNANMNLTSSLSSKLETVVKEMADLRMKFQVVQEERDSLASELGVETDMLKQRSQYLQMHCEKLSAEVVKLRRECKISDCRIVALIEENAALKRKAVETPAEGTEGEHLQKLLRDQSHLIAALREEGKLLLEQLETERKACRSKVKSLKKEKEEVEDRLKKLLSIQDIEDE